MTYSSNIHLNVVKLGERTASGNTYEELVISYWNWLLGPNPDLHVQRLRQDSILFLRPHYEYFFNIDESDNTIHRQNSERSKNISNLQTAVDQGVDTKTYLFIPVINACFHSGFGKGYKNRDGSDISPTQMRQFAISDISKTQGADHIPRSPTIKETSSDGAGQAIVDSMHQFRLEVPQTEGDTFKLSIPNTSVLAGKMEDPTETNDSDFDAVAAGYYIAFQITNPGRYIIESDAKGPRQFLATMNYQVTVS
jgi:hypothetical protein